MISARLHTTRLNGNLKSAASEFAEITGGGMKTEIKLDLGCIMLATRGNTYRGLKSEVAQEVSQGKYLYHKLV